MKRLASSKTVRLISYECIFHSAHSCQIMQLSWRDTRRHHSWSRSGSACRTSSSSIVWAGIPLFKCTWSLCQSWRHGPFCPFDDHVFLREEKHVHFGSCTLDDYCLHDYASWSFTIWYGHLDFVVRHRRTHTPPRSNLRPDVKKTFPQKYFVANLVISFRYLSIALALPLKSIILLTCAQITTQWKPWRFFINDL